MFPATLQLRFCWRRYTSSNESTNNSLFYFHHNRRQMKRKCRALWQPSTLREWLHLWGQRVSSSGWDLKGKEQLTESWVRGEVPGWERAQCFRGSQRRFIPPQEAWAEAESQGGANRAWGPNNASQAIRKGEEEDCESAVLKGLLGIW